MQSRPNPFAFDPRSEPVLRAEQRLRDAYARVSGAEVAVVEPNSPTPLPSFTEEQCLKDFDKMLARSVAWANGLAATGSDWPPFINTYCTVAMVPEAFGCEVGFNPDGIAWAKPALSSMGQVASLKRPKVGESWMIRRLAEWIDFAQRALGTDVPLWTVDLQSPFSVACQIVEHEEILMGVYTDPAAVHALCRLVTDFSIEWMRGHLAQIEHPNFPGRNFPSIPDRIGICIADDTPLVMLSPEMYREFALPYNAELSAAFGGVHVHSCGDYRANLDNLLAIPGVRSVQTHAGPGEFPLPESASEDAPFHRARRAVTCFVDPNDLSCGDAFRGRKRDLFEQYVLPRLLPGGATGLILQSCGAAQGLTVAEGVRWTRRHVAPPGA
jgi:hypothetical protein